jgi:hypothetical protein
MPMLSSDRSAARSHRVETAMEVLLIDIGALALFLGYIAIVYWHGATQESRSATRKAKQTDDAARGRHAPRSG